MSDTLEAACPECGATRKAPTEYVGRRVKCDCGATFVIEETREDEFFEIIDGSELPPPLPEKVATRHVSRGAAIATSLVAVFVAVVLFGTPSDDAVSLHVPLGIIGVETDPDKLAINEWLRENTPTGKWEELKWSGVRRVRGYRASVCFIKYRTENAFRGMSVHEHILVRPDHGKWTPFEIPSRVRQDQFYFSTIEKLYAIVASVDEDRISEIDHMVSGSDWWMRKNAIEEAEKKFANATNSEKPIEDDHRDAEPVGVQMMKAFLEDKTE